MEQYSQEMAKMKEQMKLQLTAWMKERFKPGTKPPKGITKGSASRAFKSLIQSPDEVWGDLIEQYLSGKLKSSGGDLSKSLLGTVRSQQQNKVPKGGKILATDAGHHGNPLYMLDLLADQDPEVARQFMNLANQEGFEFGDTLRNLDFFDERAHTGNRPKLNIGQEPKPGNLYGGEGLREVSGHPLGTSDQSLKIANKTYKTGDELFIAAKPSLQRAKMDLEMARFADAPRRAEVNRLLQEQGIGGVYSPDASPADVKKAQAFFQDNLAAQNKVAAAFQTPNPSQAAKHLRRVALLSPLAGASIVFSGMEVQAREQEYQANPTPLKGFQRDVARAAMVADTAALTPAAVVAEPASIGLNMLNTAIDNRSKIKAGARGVKKSAEFFRDEVVSGPTNLLRTGMQIGQQWWKNRNK